MEKDCKKNLHWSLAGYVPPGGIGLDRCLQSSLNFTELPFVSVVIMIENNILEFRNCFQWKINRQIEPLEDEAEIIDGCKGNEQSLALKIAMGVV